MSRLVHFLQYHNAIPIALGIVVLGGGATFAATNPQAIYSKTQTPISVDNTYIAGKDLSAYTSRLQIVAVAEDADNYYVEYDFFTIDVQDYVWRDVVKRLTLIVSKSALGDAGLSGYVTEQLKQNLDHEADRLRESQQFARKGVSHKQVATAYGGLVGALLDETVEALPGYSPSREPEVLPAPQGSVAVQPDTGVVASEALTREQIAQMIEQRVNELLAQRQGSASVPPPTSPSPEELAPTVSPPTEPLPPAPDPTTSSAPETPPEPAPETSLPPEPNPESPTEPTPEPVPETPPVQI